MPSAGPPPRSGRPSERHARRREHDGRHARLPARAAVSRRARRDAPRRRRSRWRARPASPYRPAMLQAEGLAHLLEGDLERPTSFFDRAVDEATSAGAVPFVPVAPGRAGPRRRSSATTGTGPRPSPTRRWRSWATADSTTTGRVRSSTPGRPHVARTGATSAQARRLVRAPPACGRCSPMPSRSCRCRRCWSWHAPTSRSPTRAGPAPCSGRSTTSAGSGRSRHPPRPGRRAAGPGRDAQAGRCWACPRSPPPSCALLPLLPSHLTLAEIAERLYVSRNTVKTQAISIYRKLGVSTRGEAIDAHAHEHAGKRGPPRKLHSERA